MTQTDTTAPGSRTAWVFAITSVAAFMARWTTSS
jgi:hypothetical protein